MGAVSQASHRCRSGPLLLCRLISRADSWTRSRARLGRVLVLSPKNSPSPDAFLPKRFHLMLDDPPFLNDHLPNFFRGG
jgi:hypothetical protein